MKAKELAKLLSENPEAEVVHYEYIGCDTPLLSIDEVEVVNKGTTLDCDPSKFVEKGKVKQNIVILKHNW